MSETEEGATRGGDRMGEFLDGEEVWEALESGLGAYLAAMVAPDEGDHLLVELAAPDDEADGCPPYAQFASFDAGRMIRAEVSGDAYLLAQYRLDEVGVEFFAGMGWDGNDATGEPQRRNWYVELPIDCADMIANHVVWALRCHFGIAHPHLLTYQAWGPASAGVGVLGLCETGEVPLDDPQAPLPTHASPVIGVEATAPLAVEPADRDELLRLVGDVLRAKYAAEPRVDDDGDLCLDHLDQPAWVRVRPEQPAVEILARVAHDVRSRRAAAVETALLNRDNMWVRWTLVERTIWQSVVVPALPFAPLHLDVMLDVFCQTLAATRDDLAFRLGATVA